MVEIKFKNLHRNFKFINVFQAVEEGKCSECEKCGWPVCKSECAKAADHQNECEFTQKRGSKVGLEIDHCQIFEKF